MQSPHQRIESIHGLDRKVVLTIKEERTVEADPTAPKEPVSADVIRNLFSTGQVRFVS